MGSRRQSSGEAAAIRPAGAMDVLGGEAVNVLGGRRHTVGGLPTKAGNEPRFFYCVERWGIRCQSGKHCGEIAARKDAEP